MSEINSIANGTYTIGQTSATNFVAGPGISITQPSEGTVRIGTDETVLWEDIPSSVTSDIPLCENPANFEYIDVFASWTYNNSQHINCYVRISGNETNFSLCGDGTYNNSSTTDYSTWRVVGDYSLSSTKITVLRAYRVTSTGSGGNNSDTLKILKVVGINRISGSNA